MLLLNLVIQNSAQSIVIRTIVDFTDFSDRLLSILIDIIIIISIIYIYFFIIYVYSDDKVYLCHILLQHRKTRCNLGRSCSVILQLKYFSIRLPNIFGSLGQFGGKKRFLGLSRQQATCSEHFCILHQNNLSIDSHCFQLKFKS